MILTVFIIGNEWDSVFQGYILTIWMIIVKLLRITLIFIGFALIGKGNLKGSWILIFLFLFGGFSWYYYLYLGEYELASITLILNGTLFILYIVIPLIYRLIRIVKLKKMY